MNRLLVTIAATALVGIPLAAQAQDREVSQVDHRQAHARPAAGHGDDASARVHDQRRGDVRNGGIDRYRYAGGRYAGDRYAGQRFEGGRGYYRDDPRFGGGVAIGFGYGGYPAGYAYGGEPYGAGYANDGDDAYGDNDAGDGYGADYAYSYPDAQGVYAPFAYGYSNRDDTYYADGGAAADDGAPYAGGGDAYDRRDAYVVDSAPGSGAYYPSQAAPNVGWSAGGPPADCGQWVWREGRGAYQWVAAPCSYPQ